MYRNNTWQQYLAELRRKVLFSDAEASCVCVWGAVTKRTLHQFGGIDSRPSSVLVFWLEGCEMDERVFCYDSHLPQR